jgi:hypothetical protein
MVVFFNEKNATSLAEKIAESPSKIGRAMTNGA